MSRVIATRPLHEKERISRAAERRYMDSFRGYPCESCGIIDDSIVAAHLNVGHGGTGYRYAGCVAALCSGCHATADGAVAASLEVRLMIWVKVCQKVLRDRAHVFSSPSERPEGE